MIKKKNIIIKISLILLPIIFVSVFSISYRLFTKKTQVKTFAQKQNFQNKKHTLKIKENKKPSNVNTEGEKYTYDIDKLKNELKDNKNGDNKKIAFLTFDDGPSVTVTPKILKQLKKSNIKATFFVIGHQLENDEASKNFIKKIFNEGHALGNHSYSHSLAKLYPKRKIDVKIYMNELKQTNEILKNIIGENFNTRITRLPGGYMSRQYYKDPNLPILESKLKENNMYWIDWNAYGLDAEGNPKKAHEIFEAIKKSLGDQKKVVILMHDTYGKEETANALPLIIEYLKNKGYEFKTLH